MLRPEGARQYRRRSSSGCSVVLVDDAAESIAPADLAAEWSRAFGLAVLRPQVDRAMRPCAGVVIDTDPEHMLEVAAVKDHSQSRHSERTVRTKRSGIAFAFGERTGVFTIS
jgi:hypothetical protein